MGLETALGRAGGLEVAWACTDATEALRQQEADPVDVMTVDLNLGGEVNGIELTDRVRRLPRPPRVIVLSAFADPGVAAAARASGASACIPKYVAVEELVGLIRTIAETPGGWFAAAGADPRPSDIRWRLSRRELEVLGLLRLGRTNREIARELRISVPTVNKHVDSLFRKLGVRNRAEAIRQTATGLASHIGRR